MIVLVKLSMQITVTDVIIHVPSQEEIEKLKAAVKEQEKQTDELQQELEDKVNACVFPFSRQAS